MPERAEFSPQDKPMVSRWHQRVMHDLVKYLEMMPRSIDWDALEDEDGEVLCEAIFETRRDRSGTRSAMQVFEATLEELSPDLAQRLSVVRSCRSRLVELEAAADGLREGDLGDVDAERIRRCLFAVGDGLRRFGEQLAGED